VRLNLFAVRDDSGRIVDDGFDNKERAKEARDELQREGGGNYYVTYGRDHRKYNPAR
jgi:hypothetical protein